MTRDDQLDFVASRIVAMTGNDYPGIRAALDALTGGEAERLRARVNTAIAESDRWATLAAAKAALRRCHALLEIANDLFDVTEQTEQWHKDAEAELTPCDEGGECPTITGDESSGRTAVRNRGQTGEEREVPVAGTPMLEKPRVGSTPTAPTTSASPSDDDGRKYSCAECGKLRSLKEGGTTFTICDDCWQRRSGWKAAAIPSAEREIDRDGLAKAIRLASHSGRYALPPDMGSDWLAAADAAIAFMRGGK